MVGGRHEQDNPWPFLAFWFAGRHQSGLPWIMLPSCLPDIAYSPLMSVAVLPVTMQLMVLFNYEHMEKYLRRSRGSESIP